MRSARVISSRIRWSMSSKHIRVLVAFTVTIVGQVSFGAEFTYNEPGDLLPGTGKGRTDTQIYVTGMRFPLESGTAYANSQYFNPGGLGYEDDPKADQCEPANYRYPWRDNFCETRGTDRPSPLCPLGHGHQGQDIRPATCKKDIHWAVAAEDAKVVLISKGELVLLSSDNRTWYEYLHMSGLQVSKVGERVIRGQRLGHVSNIFGTSGTSIHLHFGMKQRLLNNKGELLYGGSAVYIPPYMSLIASYKNHLLNPTMMPKCVPNAIKCVAGALLICDSTGFNETSSPCPSGTCKDSSTCTSGGACGGGCSSPLVCSTNGCVGQCGGQNQPCCEPGQTCSIPGEERTFCDPRSSFSCWPCGRTWSACCPGSNPCSKVTEGLGVFCEESAHTCWPCGKRGMKCCTTGMACETGTNCYPVKGSGEMRCLEKPDI